PTMLLIIANRYDGYGYRAMPSGGPSKRSSSGSKKLGVVAPTKFESASGKKRKRVYNETLGFKYLYFIVGRRLRWKE
ncbi:MAG TPA: hypothetical protein PKM99_09075, partial [Thermotogota bacterium]|nr:hypothetical protein [Thermotogota bacterium]HNT96249.1 hypothetical protein [Thermotogota bacterium]